MPSQVPPDINCNDYGRPPTVSSDRFGSFTREVFLGQLQGRQEDASISDALDSFSAHTPRITA